MSKKIIRFVTYDIGFLGGAEKVTLNLVDDFNQIGYNTGVISYYSSKQISLDKLVVLFSYKVRLRADFFKIIQKIRREIIQNDIDLLIDTGAGLSICSILAAMGTKCKVVFHAHSNFKENNSIVARISRWLLKVGGGSVVALTERDQQSYICNGMKSNKVSVIYNYVIPSTTPRKNGHNWRFLAVGTLYERKQFDLLITLFSTFSANNPNWCLDIYGEGPDKTKLQEQIYNLNMQDRIFLRGFQNNIPGLMQDYFCFLFTSRSEAFPLVLIEALGAGLPIIAFDCYTGPKEILDYNSGYLVNYRDNEAFVKAMCEMVSDECLWQKLSHGAMERATIFNRQSVLDSWKRYLEVQ